MAAEEFQEIPPTEHCVFGLGEAGPIPHRCSHISCHVLSSLLEWEIEEPPYHFYHAPHYILWDAVIYQLHQSTFQLDAYSITYDNILTND